MTHTLRDHFADELDRLDVLPDLASSTVQRGRAKVRRRRAGVGGLAVLALVGGVAAATLGGGAAGEKAHDPGSVASEPGAPSASAATPTISAEWRAHYPTQAAYADCLAGKGFYLTPDRGGGLMAELEGGEDPSAYDAATTACQIEVRGSATGLLPKDYTPADWQELYDDERTAAQCLRAQGQTVPAIPPFDEFKATYQTRHPWMAHQFVASGLTAGEFNELVWACPQPEIFAR